MAKAKVTVTSKTVLRDIPVTRIFADFVRNWRHAWKYRIVPKETYIAGQDAPGFFEDVCENGVKTHLIVSELSPDAKAQVLADFGVDADYRVLCGHRRFKCVGMANERVPGMFTVLTCEVHTGLTLLEEFAIMYDENGKEPLDEYEKFNAVATFFRKGKGQAEIIRMTGLERNLVQDMCHIAQLPEVARREYEKRFTPIVTDGKEVMPKKWDHYVPFNRTQIEELFKATNMDNDAKISHDDPASAFGKKWKEISTRTVPSGAGRDTKKALTRAAMDERKGFIAGCEALEDLHDAYNGNGNDIDNAVNKYRALERRAGLVDGLQSQVSDLTEQVAGLTALLNEKEEELLALHASHAVAAPTNGVYHDEPISANVT